MRIIQAHKYYHARDGASKYMLELSLLLTAAGHEVIPFATKDDKTLSTPYEKYFIPYVDLSHPEHVSFLDKLRIASEIIYSPRARRQMEALLDDVGHIDILHIHNIYHHISPSILLACKKRGIKIVMTLHDYKLICPNYTMYHHGMIHEEDCDHWYESCIGDRCVRDSLPHSTLSTIEMVMHHKIFRWYEKHVDLFISPSQFLIDRCVAHGWPSDMFVHIPNPVPLNSEQGIVNKEQKDGGYVAYIGRLSEEKGVQKLVEAAARLPHIPFRIAGEGSLYELLRQEIASRGIKNIELVGFLQGDALDQFTQEARLLVVPSVWYENNPLAVLEAKAKGKVVIASAIGGLPEMLPSSLLFPSGDRDALCALISRWFDADVSERESMGLALRQDVERHNNEVDHLKAVLDVYQRVLSPKI
jgi:glycosyltransferase involved in cell wall biosynthesis